MALTGALAAVEAFPAFSEASEVEFATLYDSGVKPLTDLNLTLPHYFFGFMPRAESPLRLTGQRGLAPALRLARALAARDLRRQRVEGGAPEAPELLEP